MNYVDKSVHTFTIEQIRQARNVRDLLEHVEDLKIDPVSNKIQRMDGGSVKILINGVAASDIDLKGIPADKISKVEYYNIPPARYADAGTLINVITKRMETGINAGVEARTAFTTGFTDDEAYLNLTSACETMRSVLANGLTTIHCKGTLPTKQHQPILFITTIKKRPAINSAILGMTPLSNTPITSQMT